MLAGNAVPAIQETFGRPLWLGEVTGHNSLETGHNPAGRLNATIAV
jgi:hypothetical protein